MRIVCTFSKFYFIILFYLDIEVPDISILSLLNKSRMFEERLGSFRGKGSFHEIINEEFFFSNVRAGYVKQRAVVALFHSFHSIPLKTRIVGHERKKKKKRYLSSLEKHSNPKILKIEIRHALDSISNRKREWDHDVGGRKEREG